MSRPYHARETSLLWLPALGFLLCGLLFGYLALPVAGHSGPVTCDGDVMRPGDQCLLNVNGSTSSSSYEELRARQEAGHGWEPVALTIGGGTLLIGCGLTALAVRNTRRR